jgi:hypothetical protein
VQHFAKVLAWRRSFGADSILSDWHPPVLAALQEQLPLALHGTTSRQGGVVHIERLGSIDVWGAVAFDADDLLRYHRLVLG